MVPFKWLDLPGVDGRLGCDNGRRWSGPIRRKRRVSGDCRLFRGNRWTEGLRPKQASTEAPTERRDGRTKGPTGVAGERRESTFAAVCKNQADRAKTRDLRFTTTACVRSART